MVDLGKFAKPGKVPPLAVLVLVARRVGGVQSLERLLGTTAMSVDQALDAGRGIALWLLADPELSAIPLEEQNAIFGKSVEQLRALHAAAGRSPEACQARDALKAQLLQAQEDAPAEEEAVEGAAVEGAPGRRRSRTGPQSGRTARTPGTAPRRPAMPQPDDATAAEAETLTIAALRREPELVLERDEGVSRDAALQAVVQGCRVTAKVLRSKERGGWNESGARFVLMVVLHYICGNDYDAIAGFLGGRSSGAVATALRAFIRELSKNIKARRRLQAALHQLYPRQYGAPEGVAQAAEDAGQDEAAVGARKPSQRAAAKPATAKGQDGAQRARRAPQAAPEGATAAAPPSLSQVLVLAARTGALAHDGRHPAGVPRQLLQLGPQGAEIVRRAGAGLAGNFATCLDAALQGAVPPEAVDEAALVALVFVRGAAAMVPPATSVVEEPEVVRTKRR